MDKYECQRKDQVLNCNSVRPAIINEYQVGIAPHPKGEKFDFPTAGYTYSHEDKQKFVPFLKESKISDDLNLVFLNA